MRMVRGASRINLRAVDACEASLLRPEASKPVFWRGQNAKINKIQCSSKTKKIKKDTLIVSKDTENRVFGVWCQQRVTALYTAEVWAPNSF